MISTCSMCAPFQSAAVHLVGEPQPDHVLHGRHPEHVVDAEDRLLAGAPGDPGEQGVERHRALEILAEGLLDRDPAAGRQARLAQRTHGRWRTWRAAARGRRRPARRGPRRRRRGRRLRARFRSTRPVAQRAQELLSRGWPVPRLACRSSRSAATRRNAVLSSPRARCRRPGIRPEGGLPPEARRALAAGSGRRDRPLAPNSRSGRIIAHITRRTREPAARGLPGSARNTEPASGSSPGSRSSRDVVMNSWSSCGPPNVHAVTFLAGTSTTVSRSPSGV